MVLFSFDTCFVIENGAGLSFYKEFIRTQHADFTGDDVLFVVDFFSFVLKGFICREIESVMPGIPAVGTTQAELTGWKKGGSR